MASKPQACHNTERVQQETTVGCVLVSRGAFRFVPVVRVYERVPLCVHLNREHRGDDGCEQRRKNYSSVEGR